MADTALLYKTDCYDCFGECWFIYGEQSQRTYHIGPYFADAMKALTDRGYTKSNYSPSRHAYVFTRWNARPLVPPPAQPVEELDPLARD